MALSQQLFQTRVFELQLFQALDVGYAHAGEFWLPDVDGLRGHALLFAAAATVVASASRRMRTIFSSVNRLFFMARPSVDKAVRRASLSTFSWAKFSGARHTGSPITGAEGERGWKLKGQSASTYKQTPLKLLHPPLINIMRRIATLHHRCHNGAPSRIRLRTPPLFCRRLAA